MKSSTFTRLIAISAIAASSAIVSVPAQAQSGTSAIEHIFDCKVLFWTDWTAFGEQCGGNGEFIQSKTLASPATHKGSSESECDEWDYQESLYEICDDYQN